MPVQVTVTVTHDPKRRKELDVLIARTLAGEFTVKPQPALPEASD